MTAWFMCQPLVICFNGGILASWQNGCQHFFATWQASVQRRREPGNGVFSLF
jgi:hypothetical protein